MPSGCTAEQGSCRKPGSVSSSVRAPREQHETTGATLRQVVREALGDLPADVEPRVVQGAPGRGLVETAQEAGAQLLVLSARSDRAVSRLLGTVSQHVLRSAPCPV